MSIISEINLAIDENKPTKVYRLAISSEANIEDIHETNIKKYMAELILERQRKLLNHGDIQEIIDNVNANHQVMALGSNNHRMTPRKPYFSWSMAPFANNYFQDAIWRLMEDRAFADGKQDQNQIRLTR